jgi:hypothetical protein
MLKFPLRLSAPHRPFHNVHFSIFRSSINDSAVLFSVCNLEYLTSIPSDVCSIRTLFCSISSGSFIPILLCIVCCSPRLCTPLLHCEHFHGLFLHVRPLWFLDATFSPVPSCLAVPLFSHATCAHFPHLTSALELNEW